MGCEDRSNQMMPSVMSVMDDAETMENPFGAVPRITVSDAFMKDKIRGPWLWMIALTELWEGGANSIDIDSLEVVSEGAVTEMAVATNSVAEGDGVGDLTWTLGTISGENTGDLGNINDVVNEIGLAKVT